MVEEIGVVRSVQGVTAMVQIAKKSACEGCTMGVCKPEDQGMEIEAFNEVGAKVGQRVKVSIKSYVYMKGTMLVYGLPAVMLVAGAVFGKEVMSRFLPGRDPDVLSAIFGFAAFILSFFIVKIWAGRAAEKTESRPIIEEILN
ncbi:MAG: SoxR reducing system RseC family protein [Nitrospiraceae bacterium]|nr:SoxR reducing system RseC family protein [Nitrospiraceae bacterium]